jgi:hypothetical protein
LSPSRRRACRRRCCIGSARAGCSTTRASRGSRRTNAPPRPTARQLRRCVQLVVHGEPLLVRRGVRERERQEVGRHVERMERERARRRARAPGVRLPRIAARARRAPRCDPRRRAFVREEVADALVRQSLACRAHRLEHRVHEQRVRELIVSSSCSRAGSSTDAASRLRRRRAPRRPTCSPPRRAAQPERRADRRRGDEDAQRPRRQPVEPPTDEIRHARGQLQR